MGIGELYVVLEKDGEEWENSYGIMRGFVGGGGAASDADLTAWGAAVPITDLNTSTESGADTARAAHIMHAIVTFQRLVTHKGINIKRVYISDGKKNGAGVLPSVFFSAAVSLDCLWDPTNPLDNVVGGSITCMVNRVPASFSVRNGRLFLRGALLENEVSFKGKRLVDFTSTGSKEGVQDRIMDAIGESNLQNYMGTSSTGGIGADQGLGIPHYAPKTATNKGQLIGMTQVRSLIVVAPVARQVQRGRREKNTLEVVGGG